MMRLPLLASLLLISAAPALAAGRSHGKPAEFKPPEMTEEEAAAQAARARQKNRPLGWKDLEAPPERPIPWMLIGFGGLALLVALPFGLRAYHQTRASMAEAEAGVPKLAPPPRRPKPPSKRENA